MVRKKNEKGKMHDNFYPSIIFFNDINDINPLTPYKHLSFFEADYTQLQLLMSFLSGSILTNKNKKKQKKIEEDSCSFLSSL